MIKIPLLPYKPAYGKTWKYSKAGNNILFGNYFLSCVYKSRYDDVYLFCIIHPDSGGKPAFYKDIFMDIDHARPNAAGALNATENWYRSTWIV